MNYKMDEHVLDALAPPIVPASTFLLKDAAHSLRLATKPERPTADEDGHFYSRWGGSPTTQVVGRMMAALEGCRVEEGGGTLVFASGMAAITSALMAEVGAGDHIVVPTALYGGTFEFLDVFGKKFNLEVSAVEGSDIEAWRGALRPNTKVIYAESPANPTMRLTDLEALGRLSKEHGGTRVFVDGTFATPYHQRLLEVDGVDVSIHSATKYLGGHSDLTAGLVSSNDADFLERLGKAQKLFGAVLPAMDSYLLARGMKSFDARMERHNRNALALARWLEAEKDGDGVVTAVYYPGLTSHPDHELAKRSFERGFGGMLSFEVRGGVEGGAAFVESLELVHLAVSLGSTESLIEHPASMTHAMVPRAQRLAAGISDSLIRLSVGLEAERDLREDLARGVKAVRELEGGT